MAVSDNDSYILPEQASSGDDKDKDSEDETLESLQCHARIAHDGENLVPAVDAALIPCAAAGVMAAVPHADAGVNNEDTNPQPPAVVVQNNQA